MPGTVRTAPVAQLRWAARAPRIGLIVTCTVLSIAGLRSLTASNVAPVPVASKLPLDLTDARGLATQYAVDYLTFLPGGGERRVVRLSALGAAEDTVVGDRPGTQSQTVHSATAVAESRTPNGADVTVAARRGTSWVYLRVPVRRGRGALFVPTAPAVVGAPAVSRGQLSPPEDEVQDRTLTTVAERMIRHYLQGDRGDLNADLDRGARVDPPARWLRVSRIDRTTWVRPPHRIAVGVDARGPHGLRLALRYELSVIRRSGRWLVTAIGTTTPIQKEPHR